MLFKKRRRRRRTKKLSLDWSNHYIDR